MSFIVNGLIFIVALMHVGFMILEMCYWTKPIGLKVFRQSVDNANVSKVLAANQGLYNGFLAAGLLWSLIHSDVIIATQLKFFFLSCVTVAGVFGALTVSRKIFFVQAGPAILALALLSFFYIV